MDKLKNIFLVFFTLIAFAFAEGSLAVTFGFDDRAAMGRFGKGRAGSIGLVRTNYARGTGFLISECHVLTNRHVVFPRGRENPNAKVKFFYGSDSQMQFKSNVAAKVVLWGRSAKSGTKGRFETDWAVIELEECIGANHKQGYLTLVDMPISKAIQKTSRINMAGQPGDKKTSKIWIDKRCSIYETENHSPYIWLHDCSNYKGSSGSPLYTELHGGRFGVVALNVGTRVGLKNQKKRFANELAKNQSKILRQYDQNYAGIAIPVSNFIDHIATIKKIRDDQSRAQNYY